MGRSRHLPSSQTLKNLESRTVTGTQGVHAVLSGCEEQLAVYSMAGW